MDKNKKIALISIGALAGLAAITVLALYEEDQDQTLSRFVEDTKDKAGQAKKHLEKEASKKKGEMAKQAKKASKSAQKKGWLNKKNAHRLLKLASMII